MELEMYGGIRVEGSGLYEPPYRTRAQAANMKTLTYSTMHAYCSVSRIRKLLLEASVVSPTTGNRAGTPIQNNITSKHTTQ